MSQSPTAPNSDDEASAAFLAANQQLSNLSQRGASWSGHERNCTFLNTGGPRFANISAVSGFDFLDDGRALARVDWDHDGDLDIWVTNRTAPRVRFLRNDLSNHSHFLTFQLQGTTTNRDAIGARVEVKFASPQSTSGGSATTGHPQSINTLRAGEGFISQSSKWMHFGLGNVTAIDRVVVHWPGGESEAFTNLKVDQFYRLVEGTGQAKRWTPPARKVRLHPTEPPIPKLTEQARVALTSRMLLPPLDYETFEGKRAYIDQQVETPLLINLWASWCVPCRAELRELAEQEQHFRKAGLEVVALSVDAVSQDRTAGQMAAHSTWEKLNVPFRSGLASEASVENLQRLHDFILQRHRPLPVPTSLLIDKQGRVAVIYKGPVAVDQVLKDLARLPLESEAWLQACLPFTGKMYWKSPEENSYGFLDKLVSEGKQLNALAHYMIRQAEDLQALPNFAGILARLGTALGKQDHLDLAADLLHRALDLDSKRVETRKDLGAVLLRQNRLSDAAAQFREVAKQAPQDATVRLSLGATLARHGKLQEASESLQLATQLDPQLAEAWRNLGMVYEQQSLWKEAAQQFARLVELEPGHVSHRLRLAAAQQRLGVLDTNDLGTQLLVGAQPDDPQIHYELGRFLQQQGSTAEAVALYEQTIELAPDFTVAYIKLGDIYLQQGSTARAINWYRQALQLEPERVTAANNLAWLLATSPEENLRDGVEAVRWAERSAELVGADNAATLDTVAAAYAEAGRFDDAVAAARKGYQLATAAADRELAKQLQERLRLYERQEPYRSSE